MNYLLSDQIDIMEGPLSVMTWPLKQDLHNWKSYYNTSKELHAKGRFSESLEVLQAGIEWDPFHSELYLEKGIILKSLKRYSEALNSINQSLKLNPSYIAYYNKGVVLDQLMKQNEAQ